MSSDREPREHPVVNLFPPMTGEEYQSLKADIQQAQRLYDPCRLWRGQLVDGRHRLRACRELGIEPWFVEVDGDEADMIRLVVGLNLSRRHLSSSQKAAVGVEFQDLLTKMAEEAKGRQQKHGGTAPGRPRTLPQQVGEVSSPHACEVNEQLAQSVGTNRQYVADAKMLRAEAPAVLACVKAGDLTMSAAVAQHRREKRQAAKAQVEIARAAAVGRRYRVEQADSLAFLRREPADSNDFTIFSPPFVDQRAYMEDGRPIDIPRTPEEWVAWMVENFEEALRCCTGLVACVVQGKTDDFRWDATPALLMAELHRRNICLRTPPIFHRNGIFGSGGDDWLRCDYEFIVCATRGGRLPWSDPTAMGAPPKYPPGGDPSYRRQDGSRVNGSYTPPEIANPGNVIHCKVGKGHMGSDLAHENEAPFPEALAEFLIRTFCPPEGVVCDMFCGSGTNAAVALRLGRRFVGCDVRQSQVELTLRRIDEVLAAESPSPVTS
jgi:hypothetical protein